MNPPQLVADFRRVLGSVECQSISFRTPDVVVYNAFFNAVLEAIDSAERNSTGQIALRTAPDLIVHDIAGEYMSPADHLYLAFSQARSTEDEAAIVHESVHAACDIFQIWLRITEFEVIAHIAAAIYRANKRESERRSQIQATGLSRSLNVTVGPSDPIVLSADQIASWVRGQQSTPMIPSPMLETLRQALSGSTVYQAEFGSSPNRIELVNGVSNFAARTTYDPRFGLSHLPAPRLRTPHPRLRPSRSSSMPPALHR